MRCGRRSRSAICLYSSSMPRKPFATKIDRALSMLRARRPARHSGAQQNRRGSRRNRTCCLCWRSTAGIFEFAEYSADLGRQRRMDSKTACGSNPRLPEGPGVFSARSGHRSARAFSGGRTDPRKNPHRHPAGSTTLPLAVIIDKWEETPTLIRIYATILGGARRPESDHHRRKGAIAETASALWLAKKWKPCSDRTSTSICT